MDDMDFGLDSLDILNITVRLSNGTRRTFNVEDELAINEDDLSADFIKQPGKYAWWAVLAEVAEEAVAKRKAEMESALAGADKTVRKAMEHEGIKITEGAVDKWVKKDEIYLEALAAYNKAKKNHGVLERITRAFEHRRESLVNLGAHIRRNHEGSDDISTLKSKARDITNR